MTGTRQPRRATKPGISTPAVSGHASTTAPLRPNNEAHYPQALAELLRGTGGATHPAGTNRTTQVQTIRSLQRNVGNRQVQRLVAPAAAAGSAASALHGREFGKQAFVPEPLTSFREPPRIPAPPPVTLPSAQPVPALPPVGPATPAPAPALASTAADGPSPAKGVPPGGKAAESPRQVAASAQAGTILADCGRSEAETTTAAATQQQQVSAFFRGVRERISDGVTKSIASAQELVANKQNEISAGAAQVVQMVQAAVTSTIAGAQAQANQIRTAITGAVESVAGSLQSSVQGIAGKITGALNSVSLPDIPGIAQIRAGAVSLLRQAAGAVTGALGEVMSFIRSAVSAGMNLVGSFLASFQQMVQGAVGLASSAIQQVVQMVGQALNRALSLVGTTLRGLLQATVFPTLSRVEGLITGGINRIRQQALDLIRDNRDQSLAALAPGSGSGAQGASGGAGTPDDVAQIAMQNNRRVVQGLRDKLSEVVGKVFSTITNSAAQVVQQIGVGIAKVTQTISSGIAQVVQKLMQLPEAARNFFQSMIQALSSGLSNLLGTVRSVIQNPVDRLLDFGRGALSRVTGFLGRLVSNLISGLTGGGFNLAEVLGGGFKLGESFPPAALAGGPITKPFPPALEIIIKLAASLMVAGVAALMTLLFGAELAAIIMANPLLAVAILLAIVVVVIVLIALLILLIKLLKPKPNPPKRVIRVTPAGPELGVAGRDLNATATIAPGTPANPPLTWTVSGGTPPAGVTIIGSGRSVKVHAAHPPHGTVTGGTTFAVRAALKSNPADFADSTDVMLVQIVSATYTATPALAAVPSLIPGTPPPNTAEPNRDGITGNTAVVNPTTAPAGRAINVGFRRSLGAGASGTTITPGSRTGDIGLRITDTPTAARLDETLPSTANPPTLMADLTVNAVPTGVTGLANAGALGPYGVQNRITFGATDSLHAPLTRVVGELITNGGDQFGLPPPNGAFNPVFSLALAVPADQWVDQLVTPVANPSVAAAIDANRFLGPGTTGLPRAVTYRQGFQYASWAGAGTVVSKTITNGFHIRSLIGPASNLRFKTEHRFGSVAATPHVEPYVGNPLIEFSNIAATPTAPGATSLAADGVSTADLSVNSTVGGRTVTWSVLSGDIAIIGGNPATLPATALLQAGTRTGNFKVRVADTVFPNRQADGRVPVTAVALRRIRATPNRVPPGTPSTTVSLDAQPGGRTVNWSVDAAAAARGVTVNPPVTGPGAPATSVTVTRPAGFTGSVTVTAADSVLAARTARVVVRFQ